MIQLQLFTKFKNAFLEIFIAGKRICSFQFYNLTDYSLLFWVKVTHFDSPWSLSDISNLYQRLQEHMQVENLILQKTR